MSKTELKQALLKFKHTDYKVTRTDLIQEYIGIHFPKELYKDRNKQVLIKHINSSFDNAMRKLMYDGEVKRYIQILEKPIETPKCFTFKRQIRKIVMFELINKQ